MDLAEAGAIDAWGQPPPARALRTAEKIADGAVAPGPSLRSPPPSSRRTWAASNAATHPSLGREGAGAAAGLRELTLATASRRIAPSTVTLGPDAHEARLKPIAEAMAASIAPAQSELPRISAAA